MYIDIQTNVPKFVMKIIPVNTFNANDINLKIKSIQLLFIPNSKCCLSFINFLSSLLFVSPDFRDTHFLNSVQFICIMSCLWLCDCHSAKSIIMNLSILKIMYNSQVHGLCKQGLRWRSPLLPNATKINFWR